MYRTSSSHRTAALLAVTAACAAAAVLPTAAQAFNPQPDPPGVQANTLINPGVLVGFNPQPDPPGVIRVGAVAHVIPPDPVRPAH